MTNFFLRWPTLLIAITFCSYSYGQQDSSIHKGHYFLVYGEAYGHNYYGFKNAQSTGRFSINFSYRQQLFKSVGYVMASVGWGAFQEKHSTQTPPQPRVYFKEWTNFIPIELTFQVGGKRHFVEVGYGITLAYGNHYRYYSGSQGSGENFVANHGIQYIPRIGYSYYGEDGFVLRIAYTPHYYPKSYENYQGYKLNKPSWPPLGLSFGWAF